jgi:hypothetical protein
VELCSSCGAVAVERKLERLESERDPRAHDQVNCLPFFFFLFVLFEEASLRCNSASQHSIAKKGFFFFFIFFSFFFSFAAKKRKEEGDGNKAAIAFFVAITFFTAIAFFFLC